ncbi:MAG: helix-turn-helix transcriptional regulator [Candidatus Hodarchaeota archaeon]
MKNEQTTQTCQLLSAKMLGDMLRLSKRQIFRLNSCGKIPAPLRIGGAVRWSADEISAWLAAEAPDRRTWESMKNAGHN